MILHNAIESANAAGRLGLILYTIPGYPSPGVYRAVEEFLDQSEGVSIIETTVPVTSGFSSHANEIITEAHRTAASSPASLKPLSWPRKPRLCVLYQQTVQDHGFPGSLARLRGQAEGLIIEWEDRENNLQYCHACASVGIELVQCVGPWMTDSEIENLMEMTEDDSLVYLMSADRTGGQLFSSQSLAKCVRTIRRFRQGVKVAAGFGITTSEHVQNLKGVPGLDAVIIGTAFLKAMGGGLSDAVRFLGTIAGSL